MLASSGKLIVVDSSSTRGSMKKGRFWRTCCGIEDVWEEQEIHFQFFLKSVQSFCGIFEGKQILWWEFRQIPHDILNCRGLNFSWQLEQLRDMRLDSVVHKLKSGVSQGKILAQKWLIIKRLKRFFSPWQGTKSAAERLVRKQPHGLILRPCTWGRRRRSDNPGGFTSKKTCQPASCNSSKEK